ncbi:RGCVC family protein [Actinokineospora terrae]|nr:RGCVC family protein [Actinokineospora terrae]
MPARSGGSPSLPVGCPRGRVGIGVVSRSPRVCRASAAQRGPPWAHQRSRSAGSTGGGSAELTSRTEPTPDPEAPCAVCPHPWGSHDRISARYCAATIAGAQTRACVCPTKGTP